MCREPWVLHLEVLGVLGLRGRSHAVKGCFSFAVFRAPASAMGYSKSSLDIIFRAPVDGERTQYIQIS